MIPVGSRFSVRIPLLYDLYSLSRDNISIFHFSFDTHITALNNISIVIGACIELQFSLCVWQISPRKEQGNLL